MTQQPHPYGSPPPENSSTNGDVASSNGDVARQQGEQVKDEVTEQAQAVAGTIADEASHVAHEAADHARDLAADAKQQLHRQAREQTDHLGGALGQFGDRVHALADGRPEDAGAVGDYAERIADRVDGVAARVSNLGFDGMIDEGQRFARRRPGAFLAGAAVAGFAASRLGRGVQASQQDQEQGGSTTPASRKPSSNPAAPAHAWARNSPPPMPAGPSTDTMPTPAMPPPAVATSPVDPIVATHDPAARSDPWSSEQAQR